MRSFQFVLGIFVIATHSLFAQTAGDFENNWAAWRGPLSNGVAPNSNPPVSWSENSNVKWKTAIPGKGYSTPIVWGNQVFVTTAIETNNASMAGGISHKFNVVSVNRNDGKILWQTTVAEEAVKEQIHQAASLSSNSPLTDGKNLYAYFGSRGLFCLDFQGDIIWEKDFGHQNKRNDFGEGDSPAVYGNYIVVLWDHEGASEIYCLDKNTGKDLWKKDRDEPSSWSTPLIVEYDGKTQVITAASNKVRSYDLENGEVIWECSGLTSNVVPHPVFSNGILYVMSGHRGNALMAIRLAGAKGDITGTDAIIWSTVSNTSYVPSPVLTNGRLYFLRQNSGYISCLDAANGNVHYGGEGLAGTGTVYNSPVASRDRVYVLGGTGLTYVIKEGPQFQVLSQNKLDDSFTASPAIAGDEIYLRGLNYLYCIAGD
jgi:outer membrane protein assembly factor BamB